MAAKKPAPKPAAKPGAKPGDKKAAPGKKTPPPFKKK